MDTETRPRLVIWGASGHAMVVADIVRLLGEYELVGFLDDVSPDRKGADFFGAGILGGREQLNPLRENGVMHLIVGFGKNDARLRVARLVREQGFQLGTAIHTRAVVAGDVAVGCGTVIKACAVIEVGASIGENVIVSSGAVVAHESTLEDGARLAAGATVGARARIGSGALIGINACVKSGVCVGANALIGAGSAVVQNIPDGTVAFGVPAKVMRAVTAADEC